MAIDHAVLDAARAAFPSGSQAVTLGAVVHEGPPIHKPSRIVAPGKHKYDSEGKVAVCPFCNHVHLKEVHTRLASEGLGLDVLLVVADLDDQVGKRFREPTPDELAAAGKAAKALAKETPFGDGLPARPDERIPPGNSRTIQPTA